MWTFRKPHMLVCPLLTIDMCSLHPFYRAFLRDLVEANHLFFKMLEGYSKSNTHLVVQNKRKKQHRKKKSNTGETKNKPFWL